MPDSGPGNNGGPQVPGPASDVLPTALWLPDPEYSVHQRPALPIAALLGLILTACSQSGDNSAGASGTEPPLYRLTGTVAIGRPGAWAEVCIDTDCSRANDKGVYRLLGERRGSALVSATIENADQTEVELASLYRHESAQTVALVNINPTTNALLDSWSRYQLGQSLADCKLSTSCSDNLITSFTAERQLAAQQQLQNWLTPRWQTTRNPFTDPYIADPSADWLDDLHDHLDLEATDTGLNAVDNEADILATLDYDTLFDRNASLLAVAEEALAAAYLLPPVLPADNNPITIDYLASPSSPFTVPVAWQVDVRGSTSMLQGNLTFEHTLVGPDGRVTTAIGGQFFANLSDPGPYTWTVVVTDSEGNQATDGLALQANASDVVDNPGFGAEGSCSTSPLTANASNVCISTVDGGSLGTCKPNSSGSTQTQYSPAPCSPVSQQGGAFLGSCTSVLNQVRVYHYNNPLRNTGETLSEQRTRLHNQCISEGRAWSSEPPE